MAKPQGNHRHLKTAQGWAQGQAPAVSGKVRRIIEKALSDKGLAAEWSVISQLLENDQSSP